MARLKQTSVAPGNEASAILGGFGTTKFNIALRCWATLLAQKTNDLQDKFSPQEWHCLAEVVGDIDEIEPALSRPGEILAQCLIGRHMVRGVGRRYFSGDADPQVKELANKLSALDYASAWAVIWAVRFYREYQQSIGKDDPWWTIIYRRAKLDYLNE